MTFFDEEIFAQKQMGSLRGAFGHELAEIAENDDKIVVLSADLAESNGLGEFVERRPARYVEVGIAEQNLVTVASGLAHVGFKPFAASYAAFNPGRNYEQIRTTIALNDNPVKIVATHAGINTGPDGATHQMTEDISLMRALPNMTVIAPGDEREAAEVAKFLTRYEHPAYVRMPRMEVRSFLGAKYQFEVGAVYRLKYGRDVTIFATGNMTAEALAAAEILAKNGVSTEVIHCPTITPLSINAVGEILTSIAKTRQVFTVEDHQIDGGFGSKIAEVLVRDLPYVDELSRRDFARKFAEKMPAINFWRIGMTEFGQSGEWRDLAKFYGLDAAGIAKTVAEKLVAWRAEK